MAFVHGKNTAVLIDDTDASAFLNTFSSTRAQALSNVSVFGANDEASIAGLQGGSFTVGGFWDGAAGAIHELLDGLFTDNTPIVTVAADGVDTLANACILVEGIQTSYDTASTVDDAVSVSAGGTANGGVRTGGVILHTLSAETGTLNETSHDNATSTAAGGVGHLHITADTFTSATIKVQHSTDDSVWADLITWNVTTTGASRSTVTGTVNRYLRCAITAFTGTSVTFAVAFARGTV